MILIDTNIFIDYFRGRPAAIDYFENLNEGAVLSVLVLTELLAGVRNNKERAFITRLSDVYDMLPVSFEVAQLAGEYMQTYGRSHGTGIIDALLAATAKVHRLKLVTLNIKHFPMLEDAIAPY
jgi:predicted nucleic acid-binding protein